MQFKSYNEGRENFHGTAQHVVLMDEECPKAIYSESLTRTAGTGSFEGGMTMLTFTPLSGLTPVVEMFLGETGE